MLAGSAIVLSEPYAITAKFKAIFDSNAGREIPKGISLPFKVYEIFRRIKRTSRDF